MPTPTPYSYGLTADTLTVFHDGQVHTASVSEKTGQDALAIIRNDAFRQRGDEVVRVMNPITAVTAALQSLDGMDDLNVVELRGRRLYVEGQLITDITLVDRLVAIAQQTGSAKPFLNLLRKIWRNPSEIARGEFFLWLAQSDMPITPDGDFLAYKRVRDTYKDIHSNTLDYSVGKVVQMDREKVDPDRQRTCSAGLHFCSKSYLPHFSSNGNTDRVVLLRINPADVVAIPADYNNAKGRAWRVEVVGEVPLGSVSGLTWAAVTHDYDNDTFGDACDPQDLPKFNPPVPAYVASVLQSDGTWSTLPASLPGYSPNRFEGVRFVQYLRADDEDELCLYDEYDDDYVLNNMMADRAYRIVAGEPDAEGYTLFAIGYIDPEDNKKKWGFQAGCRDYTLTQARAHWGKRSKGVSWLRIQDAKRNSQTVRGGDGIYHHPVTMTRAKRFSDAIEAFVAYRPEP